MANLVGDVSSAARILPDLHGETLFIRKGKGAWLWDDKGRRYIDTALGFGAVLLGHANDTVNEAVTQALHDSASPSWAHVREHAAATALAKHTGALSKVMFTNSGSEAVHLACRAARAYTGRGKIAKMAAGFDGWFDDVSFGNVTSREANFADGARPSTERTTLLRFNDFADVERLFADDPDIAAVILEPMLANAGCIMPLPGYLKHVQDVAHRHGALVICDEVLMGFRLFAGLAGLREGLDPDLASVGKAIGNGVPVSAVVGKPEILQGFEEGRVARGGTFSGNPLACAAAMATLDIFESDKVIEQNQALAAHMGKALERFNDHPHVAEVRQTGMIAAVEMVKDKRSREVYDWRERRGLRVYQHALTRQALLRPLGNVTYFMPPYIITPEQIDHLADVAWEGINLATQD